MQIVDLENKKDLHKLDLDLPESHFSKISRNPLFNSLDVRNNPRPNLTLILELLGPERAAIEMYIHEVVSDGKATLVGGIANAVLGWQIPKIHGLFQIVNNIPYFPLPDVLASARRCQGYRENSFDVDIARPSLDNYLLPDSTFLNLYIKNDPKRIIVNKGGYHGYSISVTEDDPNCPLNVRSCSNLHTSVDEIKLPIGPNLEINVDPETINNNPILQIEGDVDEAFKETGENGNRYTSIVILRFIAQSLLTRDTKRIEMSFGASKKAENMLFALMLKSMVGIIRKKERESDLYLWFLDIINPNWPLLDDKIKKVVDCAVMFS